VIVGAGKNWNIPAFWAPLLKYVAAPILAIIFSFGYPQFYALRNDPVYIFGFIVSHFILITIGLGFIVPRWFDVFVPAHRREDGQRPTAPNVLSGVVEAERDGGMEVGSDRASDVTESKE
jgi:solute carrier family 6 GABA transporter-like protein 1